MRELQLGLEGRSFHGEKSVMERESVDGEKCLDSKGKRGRSRCFQCEIERGTLVFCKCNVQKALRTASSLIHCRLKVIRYVTERRKYRLLTYRNCRTGNEERNFENQARGASYSDCAMREGHEQRCRERRRKNTHYASRC